MRCNRKTACFAVTPRKKWWVVGLLPRLGSYAAVKTELKIKIVAD